MSTLPARISRCEARRTRGFTLIEIMVVIVIIGLLVSVVGPNLMSKLGSAKTKTARIQLEDLAAALDLYFLEVGAYPSSQEGLTALISQPPNVAKWHGPYLRKSVLPRDPWGNPFVYEFPGTHGPYDLRSMGADGKEGGSDDAADIVSWE